MLIKGFARFLGVVIALLSLWTFPAGAQSQSVKVGIYQNAPKLYLDKNNQPAGFFPAILNEIAKAERWSIEYIPCTWNACLEKVEDGELDLMMDVAFSDERAKRFDFNREVVLANWSRIYTHNGDKIRSILDLDKKRVAVVKGSIQARRLIADAQAYSILPIFIEVDTFAAVFDLIARGEADAGIVNRLFGAQQKDNFKIHQTGVVLYPSRLMFIAPKGKNAALLQRIDKHISAMRADYASSYYAALEKVFASGQKIVAPALPLNAEEQSWLAGKDEIRIAINNAWPPMDYVDESGKVHGIGVDFIGALNRRLGGIIKIEPGAWAEIYEGVKEKRIDALMDITPRPDREPYFNFTKPYVHVPHVIFARTDAPYYDSLDDLIGKTIGVERGFFIVRVLHEKYPGITVKEFSTTSDALDAVSKGEADAYVGNRAVAMYIIEREVLANLRAFGKVEETASVNAIGVRKDWPVLQSILQKALNSITTQETSRILQNWVELELDQALSKPALTDEEQKWLRIHPVIRATSELDWPPYDFVDNGKSSGYAIDYLNLLAEKLDIKIEYTSGQWSDLMTKFKAGEVDIIHPLHYSDERTAFMQFTEPFMTLSSVMAVREDDADIKTLRQLQGKTLASGEGWLMTDYVRREHPEIKILLVKNSLEGLKAVQFGDADAWIDSYGTTRYLIDQHFMTNLIITGEVADLGELRFADHHIGVRKDWPQFTKILQKTVDSVTPEEKHRLVTKWNIYSGSVSQLRLNQKEREWLEQNDVIRLGYDIDWPPVEFAGSDGRFQGMSAEFMKRISDVLGVRIESAQPQSWQRTITAIKKGEVDILSAAMRTEQRDQFLYFTKPYLSFPMVIVTKEDVSYIGNMAELNGRRVTVVDGYASHDILTRRHSDLNLMPTQDVKEGLFSVAHGDAFAFVGSLATVSHVIGREGISGLKVTGDTPYNFDLSIAVSKDQPVLVGLMQKALDTISEEDRSGIYRRWISVKYAHEFDYALLWKVLVAAGVVLLVIVVWNRKLAREIKLRKLAEAELKAANRKLQELDQLKSMFIASVSHELRTPLNTIIGFTGLLLQGVDGGISPEQREDLNRVKKAGHHLLSMITEVIDISKIEAGRIEVFGEAFSLMELIAEAADATEPERDAKGLSLSIECPQDIEMRTDRKRLMQCVLNFLSNAVKYSQQGGITVRVRERDGQAEIAVSDTGIGVADVHMDALFEAFERLPTHLRVKEGGSGLGLYLTKKIATELLGGTVHAESKQGKGSTFTIVVPLTLPGEPAHADQQGHLA